jgi:hypothetical protein
LVALEIFIEPRNRAVEKVDFILWLCERMSFTRITDEHRRLVEAAQGNKREFWLERQDSIVRRKSA